MQPPTEPYVDPSGLGEKSGLAGICGPSCSVLRDNVYLKNWISSFWVKIAGSFPCALFLPFRASQLLICC